MQGVVAGIALCWLIVTCLVRVVGVSCIDCRVSLCLQFQDVSESCCVLYELLVLLVSADPDLSCCYMCIVQAGMLVVLKAWPLQGTDSLVQRLCLLPSAGITCASHAGLWLSEWCMCWHALLTAGRFSSVFCRLGVRVPYCQTAGLQLLQMCYILFWT